MPDKFKLMKGPNKLPELTQLQYPMYCQPKLDGWRAIFIEGKFVSATGKDIKNTNLSKYFSSLQNLTGWVLDGELYKHGITLGNHTTILNSIDKPIPEGFKFRVFDAIPLSAWKSRSYNRGYDLRISDVRAILNDIVADYKKVIDVPTDLVDGAGEVVELYKGYLTSGHEGVMLKSVEGLYKWGKTTMKSGVMYKVKPAETKDVRVESIYAGKDSFEGMAGGFTFTSDDGTSIPVGAGITHAVRKAMIDKPDEYIGRMVEIAYFKDTEDGKLRDARFKRWRDDKDM